MILERDMFECLWGDVVDVEEEIDGGRYSHILLNMYEILKKFKGKKNKSKRIKEFIFII